MSDDIVVISVPSPTETADDLYASALSTLTDAERAVILLVLAGATSAEVAARRRTSVHTIAKQLASAFRKLDVYSRAELAARLDELHRTSR